MASFILHALGAETRWAYRDWVISRVGYKGNDFVGLYTQVREPLNSDNPVDHTLLIYGREPERWQSPLFNDSRQRIEAFLDSLPELQPA